MIKSWKFPNRPWNHVQYFSQSSASYSGPSLDATIAEKIMCSFPKRIYFLFMYLSFFSIFFPDSLLFSHFPSSVTHPCYPFSTKSYSSEVATEDVL